MINKKLKTLPDMLEKEIKRFKEEQDQLRTKYPNGGFVVIKDDEIYGVWENRNDALKEGYEKYGDVPFLVKNINDDLSQAINFSRNLQFPDVVRFGDPISQLNTQIFNRLAPSARSLLHRQDLSLKNYKKREKRV